MIEHQLHNSYDTYNAFIYTNKTYNPHFHKNYELIYIMKGEMTVDIINRPVHLLEGEMLLISPFSVHSFVADQNTRIWVAVFSEGYFSSFAKKNNHLQYSKFRCEQTIEDFLGKYLFFEGTPDLHIGKACMHLICSECLKKATIDTINLEQDFKQKVIEFIYANLSNEITLQTIAQTMGFEYHYFSSLFHACFHMNFKEFVNIFRYEYASEMLLDKTKDISYIAGECGFQSIRNFNRVFKKLSGKTPSEFRNSL